MSRAILAVRTLDVVKIGEQVAAYVIQVDRGKSRIALSIKRLRPNPWETAETRYRPGDVVEAMVTSVVPYGAFARLEEGLDGLIHSTEFDMDETGQSIDHNCQEGQTILVRVINGDAARQLGLASRLMTVVQRARWAIAYGVLCGFSGRSDLLSAAPQVKPSFWDFRHPTAGCVTPAVNQPGVYAPPYGTGAGCHPAALFD
jgi:predicted RNA-binding protein with RPS1 domain